jgi:gas vesicle protein
MGFFKGLVKFGAGSVLGGVTGIAAVVFFAPQSGGDLQKKVASRLHAAKLAGLEAQAEKEEELIRRFRKTVNDPGALEETRKEALATVNDFIRNSPAR